MPALEVGVASAAAIFIVLLVATWIISPLLEAFRSPSPAEEIQSYKSVPPDTAPDPGAAIYEKAKCHLSVVIPAFNEEKRLPPCMRTTIDYLLQRQIADPHFTFEVVVVDDGSTDETALEAENAVGECRPLPFALAVVRLRRNRGKGFAVKAGVCCARGEYILMMDADGATEITDLQRLEQKLLVAKMRNVAVPPGGPPPPQAGAPDVPPSPLPLKSGSLPPGRILPEADLGCPSRPDPPSISEAASGGPVSAAIREQLLSSESHIAIGSRQHLVSTEVVAKRSWHRNLLMRGFHVLVCFVAGDEIQDTQCGFKLFSRSAARRIFPSLHLSHWAFDVEAMVIAKRLGIGVEEVPVNWQEVSGSKLNPLQAAFEMARDMMLIKVLYAAGVWKVRPHERVP